MTTAAMREAPNHDSLTCYTDYQCRRPECVERKRQWQVNYRAKQRQGQSVLIDARPVREHIETLQAAGLSPHRIALAAGLGDWTVRSFLPNACRPRKHQTSPDIAAKILAVTADTTPGYTDSTGTRRRIQALTANGWPARALGAPLGLHPTYVRVLLGGTGGSVYTATAEKTSRAYEKIKRRRPERHGVAETAAAAARALGVENRWPTPRYWDRHPGGIDDPHFTPEYGKTRLEILAEDARWLMVASRLDRDLAAERLGVDRSYLDRALAAHPQVGLEAAS